ncbi:MAG: peptidase S10 [Thermodesulfobacteriota bacterium]|nr:peptidase S10 [Thermodesulfobacteriota bacterium]
MKSSTGKDSSHKSGRLDEHYLLTLAMLFCIYFLFIPTPPCVSGECEGTAVLDIAETAVLNFSNKAVTNHTLQGTNTTLTYSTTAASLTVIGEDREPGSRIFYIYYAADDQSSKTQRPVTFVFNGGPGAASAYLHMGALGPKRILFGEKGNVLPTPVRLHDNPKSWLQFTDLIFIDPVGTGYSRLIPENNGKNKKETRNNSNDIPVKKQAWGVEEDANSLARFIRAFLTQEQRWRSPVFLVGESYGGFRVARLSNLLQSTYGIAPRGLVLVSPVLDFSLLWGGSHSLWPWVALLPSYTAVAAIHEQSTEISYQADKPRASLAGVEQLALSEYLSGLARGELEGEWLTTTSCLTGINTRILQRSTGRIPPARFAKLLLSDQQRLVSLYDGSITLIDSEPAHQELTSGDLYLEQLNIPVTAAFNSYISEELHFKTELPYLLLNDDVFKSWNWHSGIQGSQGFADTATDLKKAMSRNPQMQVLIMHGVFDLVTPYFSSAITIRQMSLDTAIRNNIQLKVYHGGHMPYLHQNAFEAMFKDGSVFYKQEN